MRTAELTAEPLYRGDGVTLWLGDARALPIASESVHLIVTSPPYNARVNYDGYDDWLPWDEYWHGLIEASLQECYRVLVHGGRIALNIANVVRCDVPPAGHRGRPTQYQSRNKRRWKPPGANGRSWSVMVAPRLWTMLEEIGFLPREHLTWVKGDNPEDIGTHSAAWGTFGSPVNPVLRGAAEPVLIASKGTHAREPKSSDLTPAEFKAWTRNAWFIRTGHADQTLPHPAMFPIELPRRLIKLYSYPGDVVLDPFMGSGTTLRAAKDLRRVALGMEISERYCRLAAARCAQSLLPLEGAGLSVKGHVSVEFSI